MAPDGRWGVVLDSMYSWHADCAGNPPDVARCRRRQMVSGFGQDIDACMAVAWRPWRPLSNGRLLGQPVECGSDSWRLATVDSRR